MRCLESSPAEQTARQPAAGGAATVWASPSQGRAFVFSAVIAGALALAGTSVATPRAVAQRISDLTERTLEAPSPGDTSLSAREREAVDLLIANELEAAHRAYRDLASSAPQRVEYAVMVKLLARALTKK